MKTKRELDHEEFVKDYPGIVPRVLRLNNRTIEVRYDAKSIALFITDDTAGAGYPPNLSHIAISLPPHLLSELVETLFWAESSREIHTTTKDK